MKAIFLSLVAALLLLSACDNSQQKEKQQKPDQQNEVQQVEEQTIAPITRDIEFMIFLHRFAEDPDYQMEHIKFPLGKLSYAMIENPDGDFFMDNYTSRYWNHEEGNYMRVSAPGYFVWKNDNKIVYDYNSSMLDDYGAEFGTSYTFEKIDGEWYVTEGDFYGSDVGFADYLAQEVEAANKKFRKTHTTPYEPYEYNGTPGDYPQASERLLTEQDLQGLGPKELRMMRNEIMARHGYAFQSKDLKKHFDAQPWYSALFRNVEKQLTPIEKENVEFIKAHEK